MKLKSLFSGEEFNFTIKIGDDVLTTDGKKDWVKEIIYRKVDASVLLANNGYEVASKLQQYNERYNPDFKKPECLTQP